MSNNVLTIGNVQITCIHDATIEHFPMTLDQVFPSVTSEQWQPYRERYPALFPEPMRWRPEVDTYLIRSSGRTILVDTGAGPGGTAVADFLGTSGVLPAQLDEAGIAPGDVSVVVLTHLHFDHVGWNLSGEGASARPTFPNARYRVHRADWDAFGTKEVQAHFPFEFVDQTITPLQRLGVLDLIDGDTAVTDEIMLIHTPGHTPGSMSVMISSGGEKAVIWGDAFVHPATVTEPDWPFAFEMDPATAAQTRRTLLDKIEAESMTAISCHFPEPGFGHIVRIDGRRYWQGI
jgi:glyoxylase-like metal-dependent hydrolase (beta-lactamase superfamily II)